jgi:hypothetical protein
LNGVDVKTLARLGGQHVDEGGSIRGGFAVGWHASADLISFFGGPCSLTLAADGSTGKSGRHVS